MSKEILTDELLKEAVAKAFEMESSMYERMAGSAGEHEFSPEYRQRMEALAAPRGDGKVKGFGKRRKWLRIAAAAVIFIVMSGTAVSAIDPMHEKMYEMLEFTFPDHTEISFKELADDEEAKGKEITSENFQVRRLKAPPEYTKVKVSTNYYFKSYSECYDDGNGYCMYYEQYDMKMLADSAGWTVTSNGEKAKTISVDGKKAYLITDDYDYHSIIYIRDGYLYNISGHGDAGKLVRMLESAFEEEPSADPDWWKKPSEGIEKRYAVKELKNIPEYYEPDWGEEDLETFETIRAYSSNKENGRDGFYQLRFSQQPLEYFHTVEAAGNRAAGNMAGKNILVGDEDAYLLSGADGQRKVVFVRDGMAYTLEGDEEPEVLAQILEATVFD